MDHLEAAAAGFEAGWGGSSEEDSSDCRAVVCRMGGQKGGGVLQVGRRSLVWGFVGFQKLLRERVDLVSTSNFVGQ